jgi:diguanylate cyclase
MNQPVHQFNSSEIETALSVLNTAIKNHRLWFDRLHTSIVCEQPFSKDILNDEAHKQCEFGKWYYGEVNDSIKSVKQFSAIEPVHTYMHSYARDLARLSRDRKTIKVESYQAFLTNQHHLIDLLTQLRDTLIEHEYCFDAVTGAVNRRSISLLLEQYFERAQRYNQRYSLAMLDVDHFKNINDQYGHITGDYVLKYICAHFRESLRKSDCVGRYGGEEFLILLPETNLDQAFNLVDKARLSLFKKNIVVEKETIKVSVSLGVTEILSSDTNAGQAIKRSDDALYKAKKSGRNCALKA